jgi:hypothetical protein
VGSDRARVLSGLAGEEALRTRLRSARNPSPTRWGRSADDSEAVRKRDGMRNVDGTEAEETEAALELHRGARLAERLRDLGGVPSSGEQVQHL